MKSSVETPLLPKKEKLDLKSKPKVKFPIYSGYQSFV
jgi:hypothetical protein